MKELIPEFFSLPEMFNNGDDDRFNRMDDEENGETNDDHVTLPKWAQTPEDFIRINRAVSVYLEPQPWTRISRR